MNKDFVLILFSFIDSVDTENSNVFTDFKMDPDELKTVARKRRFINLDPKPNQRRKRALTAYDFYDEEDPVRTKSFVYHVTIYNRFFLKVFNKL